MWKKIKRLLILGLSLLVIGFSAFYLFQKSQAAQPTINSSLIGTRLEQAKDLTTTKYYYQNTASFENDKEFYGWTVPFTNKFFIIAYDGVIHAGINLNDVQIEVEKKEIKLTLPPAKILSHEIDSHSIRVLNERDSVFNRIQISEFTDFSNDQKAEMEKEAIAKGILEEANQLSQEAIREILQIDPLIAEDYQIVFQ